jgi:hypothetical protein
MKKLFIVLTLAAVVVAFTLPATAAMKITTKGRMDVTGVLISENIVTDKTNDLDNDDINAYYQQELVIDPVLHINDKVRIHNRVTIMERYWQGQGVNGGSDDPNSGFGGAAPQFGLGDTNYRGQHNFWWERMYMSFPLFGGTFYAGRMSGGSWAFPWQDSDLNRDRLKYVRKFGSVLLIGVIEKGSEGDGANPPWLTTNPNNVSFNITANDSDRWAVGAVVPLTDWLRWRPLAYFIYNQNGASTANVPGHQDGYTLYVPNAFDATFGNFNVDLEVGMWWTNEDDWALDATGQSKDRDEMQWTAWGEVGYGAGPGKLAFGGFWMQGTNDVDSWNNRSNSTSGAEFAPYLLLFSEDMGLLWNTNGVANGSSGASGFVSLYLRGEYKLSDTMKLSGVLGYLSADVIKRSNVYPTAAVLGAPVKPDEELGLEFDVTFDWRLMDNLTWTTTGGYLAAGDYWDDAYGDSNDPFGLHSSLVINF